MEKTKSHSNGMRQFFQLKGHLKTIQPPENKMEILAGIFANKIPALAPFGKTL